jgi:hypothetical protein
MLYLACKLHLPSGETLNRYVVCVDEGEVVWWTPFESECQSMVFVQELLLSPSPGLQSLHAVDAVCSQTTDVLYLYEVKSGGELLRLY